jgi:hypothetical protein
METKDHFVGTLNGYKYRRVNKSENYVRIPPALMITDDRGDVWSIGNEYVQNGWRLFWNVLRNDKDTGEMAEYVEFNKGRVRIFSPSGPKIWNGRSF